MGKILYVWVDNPNETRNEQDQFGNMGATMKGDDVLVGSFFELVLVFPPLPPNYVRASTRVNAH